MKLEVMSMKDLLALHNQVADKPAGPKTFATRVKLVGRIESIAAARSIDLASLGHGQPPEVAKQLAQPQSDVAEATTKPTEADSKPYGKGIGTLARHLLMDPTGYPHALIADRVNAQIDGAHATDKSVRWYAHEMRKKGIAVPKRQKVHAAEMGAEQ